MSINFARAAVLFVTLVFVTGCEETLGEKAQAVKNDAVRGSTEAVNRVQEATCASSDAECLAKQAQNRINEAAAAVKDKATELKNEVD